MDKLTTLQEKRNKLESLSEVIEDFICCSGDCLGHPEKTIALKIVKELLEPLPIDCPLPDTFEELRAPVTSNLPAAVAIIERVCAANEALIRQRIAEGRPLPKMYESVLGIDPWRRRLSSDGETVLNAEALLSRGLADVDELVAWRVAELRVEGEPAQVGAFQRIVPVDRHIPSYAFVCVIRGDGRIEQPERAEHWKAERPPSRCRIVVKGDHWGCLSAGCGAEGVVEGGRLTYPYSVATIAAAEATGPHPYTEEEVCLFEQLPTKAVAGAQTLKPQRITYCGQQVDVACDRRCDKAWGRDSRPRKQLSDNPDDYVFVSDGELGTAPFPSDSTEGDQGKPSGTSHQGPLNKWCVRQCERSVMVDAGKPIALRDFERPLPNILRR